MSDAKKTVLVIGGGAVGAIAALNLEVGGLATVTAVLRSNYNVVKEKGYHIDSCDLGVFNGWRPSVGRLPAFCYQATSRKTYLEKPAKFDLTKTSSQFCSEPH